MKLTTVPCDQLSRQLKNARKTISCCTKLENSNNNKLLFVQREYFFRETERGRARVLKYKEAAFVNDVCVCKRVFKMCFAGVVLKSAVSKVTK